ncbi:MAG: hypothetical protein QNJ51_00235 [Calothrix sp. MO_167.B12]|nr:hypothetical protein [Calothrix sp. MO_167.B12]
MHILATIQKEHWQVLIGDPTPIGWLTFVAYLIACFLCVFWALRISRFSSLRQSGQLPWLWWSLAIILLLLGLNKQLDIQSWLRIASKELTIAQGWSNHRSTMYIGSAAVLFTTVLALLVFVGRALRNLWQKYWLVLLGLVFLNSYILFRAPPIFRATRLLLNWRLEELQNSWLLEIAGIACIGVSAMNNLRNFRK